MDRNIEIRANAIYPILQEGHSENKIKNAQFHAYIKGATEQRAIDDVELAEVKRQRDEYYDELIKLRQQKAIDDAELHTIEATGYKKPSPKAEVAAPKSEPIEVAVEEGKDDLPF